ncbi:MAG: hypothetical protein WCO65_02070 [bacterium]
MEQQEKNQLISKSDKYFVDTGFPDSPLKVMIRKIINGLNNKEKVIGIIISKKEINILKRPGVKEILLEILKELGITKFTEIDYEGTKIILR